MVEVAVASSVVTANSSFLMNCISIKKMKSSLILLLAAGTAQAFVASPSAATSSILRPTESALLAESKFGFKPYVSGQDVNRADTRDTWFPADKPLYKPSGKTDVKLKVWVPFAKDPYGHAKVIQTDEELQAQVGAEMTKDRPKAPKPKSSGVTLMNGEGDVLKRYPRWIQRC